MFALAVGKARTGRALGNPVLQTEGRVTLIDGILATAVLLGLVLMQRPDCGRPIPQPGTCSSTTLPGRCGRSSPTATDAGGQDAPGWHGQRQDSPAQARRPSITAHPAIPNATTPSTHQAPSTVLAPRPANTAIAR